MRRRDLVTKNEWCTPFRMRLWSLHFDLLAKAAKAPHEDPPSEESEKTLVSGLWLWLK